MRRQYYYTKTTIILIVIFIISIFVCITNSIELWKYAHPYDLDEGTVADLKCGQYAKITVEEYLVSYFYDRKDQYGTVSLTEITFWYDYDTYTIFTNDGMYLRALVFDRATIDELEKYDRGRGKPLVLIGKVESAVEPNEDWYESVEGYEKEHMVQDKCLRQKTSNLANRNTLGTGIIIALLSLIGIIRTTIRFEYDMDDLEQ